MEQVGGQGYLERAAWVIAKVLRGRLGEELGGSLEEDWWEEEEEGE